MFRDRLVHWAGMLNFLTSTMSTILVQAKGLHVNGKASFGRRWESTTQERNFERNLAIQQGYNNFQSRLPVAR
jgi:hypothetical protein